MADFGEVGSASVALRARQDRLEGDLRRARGDIGRSADRAGREYGNRFGNAVRRSIGPALAAAFSVAALRGFTNAAKKAIDTLDEIAKSADAIGVTTDALQALRVQADLSGVSTAELDTSLRRFARTASDAGEGLSTAERAFKTVGVEVKATNGQLKDIPTLLTEVARGFQGMEDKTRAAAVAQELFGRAGTSMVNLLRDFPGPVDQIIDRFRELGVVIEEDLIRETVRLKDEMTLLERQLSTDTTQALVRLGPVIRDLGRLMVWLAGVTASAVEGFRQLARAEIGATQAEVVRRQISQTRSELELLNRQINEFGRDAPDPSLGDIETGLFQPGPQPADDPEQLNQQLDNFIARREGLVDRLETLQERLGTIQGSGVTPVSITGEPALPEAPSGGAGLGGVGGGAAASAIEERIESFSRMAEALQDQIDREQQLRTEIQATAATLGEEESARESLLSQLEFERIERELLRAEQMATTDAQREEIANARELLQILREVTGARIQDSQALKDQQTALRETTQGEQQLVSALKQTGDELVRVAFEGGNVIEVLARLLLRILEIQATQMEKGGGSLLGSILGAVLGAVGAGVGAGVGGGTGFGAGSTGVNSFTTTGFAEGGLPPVGQFSLVGERGPEVAFFGSAARVFSNEDLQEALSGAGRGQAVNVTFNIATPDVGGFRRSAPQIAAEFRQTLGRAQRQE